MRRTFAAAGLGLFVLAGGLRADIVLHPGTVTGTAGLSNWSFDSGSVYVGNNPNGFSGSASVSGVAGSTYAVTVEGGQTYGSLSESLTTNNPYTSFSMSRTVSLTVPVGGSASGQDLLTPGGTIQVDVSATTAAGASAVLSNLSMFAYGANAAGTESYSWYGYAYGANSVQLPMAATQAAVNVYGYVYFSLTDQNGQSCYVSRSIPYPYPTVASLSDGEVATLDQAFDLSGELCATGVGSITRDAAAQLAAGGIRADLGSDLRERAGVAVRADQRQPDGVLLHEPAGRVLLGLCVRAVQRRQLDEPEPVAERRAELRVHPGRRHVHA